MMNVVCNLLSCERGASAPEYAVIAVGLALPMLAFLSLISIACGSVLGNTGPALAALGQNGR